MTRVRNSLSFLVFCLHVVACDTPSVNEFAPHTGLIRGTLVYPAGTARGNVIISLFEEDKLPPPQGTFGPANFVVVKESELFGDSDPEFVSDFSAPFTIPSVPAGRYQIRAFLDADGDFNPIYDLVNQPTAGDVGGGFVDIETKAYKIVEVQT